MKRFRLPILLVAAALLIGGATWNRFGDPTSPAADSAVSTSNVTGPAPAKRPDTKGPPTTKSEPTTAPAPTTTIAPNPKAYATALFADWVKRDRNSAELLASPDVIKTLFARRWHDTDGWVAQACTSATGSTFCSWKRPGRTFVFQVRAVTATLPYSVVALQLTH